LGSVQSLVPSARPMKLATAMGASFSKSLQVRRPMVVSMTAVGPVGTAGGLICVVVLGASGSCWVEAGVDCVCACDEKTLKARTSARVRNIMRGLAPINRLTHIRRLEQRVGASPRAAGESNGVGCDAILARRR